MSDRTTPTDPPSFAAGLLPAVLDRDTAPFWAAARQRRLTYQTCDACAAVVFFPRRHCPGCLSAALTWHDSAGLGEVYTYSVVRNSRDPRFADRVPYCVAWIDLDEGFRMMSNVVEVDPDAITVGLRVRVDWRASGDWLLPVFVPADPALPADPAVPAEPADGAPAVGSGDD
ncbi:Zn-ribbon domain-containing OB-fold protein [Polymorphospora lycopeni]|uniref:Zn-ribbon domain-containing OB-fold protein n=1 Tax=Polymorphospora lycopeni TaxID=3140240 RepID=A0ABV5CU55_9ACTN